MRVNIGLRGLRKDSSRPVLHSQDAEGGMGRSTAAYAGEGIRDVQEPKHFYRPSGGTDVSFCIISQHFVLGYFH